MKIAFAGGGTAGHLTPALAIAQQCTRHYPNCDVVFFTSNNDIENTILSHYPYKTYKIPIHNIPRKLSYETLKKCLSIPRAVRVAKQYLMTYHPQLVVCTGGYVSYPVMIAAHRLGIPCVLHESNSIPGLVTRVTAKKAACILLNFAECKGHLPPMCKSHVIGNFMLMPRQMTSPSKLKRQLEIPENAFTVFAFGGSLGAQTINESVVQLAFHQEIQQKNVHFILVTGKNNYSHTMALLSQKSNILPDNIHVFSYIEHMSDYWSVADAVICRAGSCTLSELGYFQKAGIVIPYPQSTKDHQKRNALAYFKAGGCMYLEDSDVTEESLKTNLFFLLEHPNIRHALETAAKRCTKVNAFSELFAIFSLYI